MNVEEKHHVHSSYIWLGSLRVLLTILLVTVISMGSTVAGMVSEGMFASEGGSFVALVMLGIFVGFLVVISGIVVAYQWISYKHIYFTLTEREFNLYSGIISKKRVHVPYRRVQSVDQRASLFQRIFGVCTVSIDTAGGSNNKAVNVPYLTKQQAEWLRTELFTRKSRELYASSSGLQNDVGERREGALSLPRQGQNPRPAQGASLDAQAPQGNVLDFGKDIWREVGGIFTGQGAAPVDQGRVTFEYGLTNKELVLTGLSNNTAFALAVIAVVSVLAQGLSLALDIFPKQTQSVVEGVVVSAMGSFAIQTIVAGIASLVGVLLVVWLISAAVSCINYGGFRARRRASRIEVEHGLLQHTFQGIDVDRVQSVVVKQTFIRRLMGYCEISLGKINAAEGDDASGQSATVQSSLVVHPFVKLERVPEILAGIIPEYNGVPREVLPVAPVALRRALIRRCLWQSLGFWMLVAVALLFAGAKAMGAEGLARMFDVAPGQAAFVMGSVTAGLLVLGVIAVLLIVLDAVGAVLWFRESSFAFNERFMQVTVGGFSRETASFMRQKIQFGYTRTNPFQRIAHTATINARTAAGVGGTSLRLIDVREEDAQAWLAWLKPRGNMLQ